MSYNGYNYSHYFNQPTSQSTGRQESQPNQQRTSAVSNLSVSPYHQQQTGVQSSTTNQPRQLNDRQQPSPQVPPDQWYLGGNVTSRGYQGSMAATSGSGPQTQYMNGVGRNGRSHIDTSALGSLAYASGLESSGADGQLSQTNRRSASDYGMNQRRMQTPPARLVSPMRDNSTTPFNNSHNHVRSDSVSSSHSQSKPRSSNPQQQSASGYDNSSLANANYEPYRQRQVGPISDPDVPSHYKGYSSKLTSNSGADLSQYEAYNSRFSTQQAQSSVPQHRIHSPRESQHANPSVQLENPRWQTFSTYRTQSPRAQETNAHPSQPSPINTSQRTQPPVDKFALLDPALPKTETISTATSQTSGQSDRSGHLPRQLHQTPSFRNNNSQGLQDSTAQMEQPRQRHPSQGQEQNNAQSHSLHNIVHHDQQHQSPPALPAAPITVDPSRVFNPYHHEYQLRKAIAEAEEARTVAQAKSPLHNNVADPVSALAPPAERQALPQASLEVRTAILGDQQKIGGPAISRTDARNGNVAVRSERDANIVTTGSGSGDKEQMEAEMRLMLEKMREYKSKDPSLFLQIWEQVKKGTLQISTKTQVLSQGTHAGQESSQAQTQPPLGTNGFTPAIHTHDSQLPSPSRTLVQQPIAWEPPDESLPDLGRFPAMRRRRGAGRKPRLVKDSQTGSSPQSDHLATPSQTSQTLAYEHQNRSFPAGSALGLKSYVQTGQLNGNLDSSKTTPGHRIRSPAGLEDRPTSRLPSEVPPHPQSERQVSGSIGLEGEHALHSDTAQTRTPTPSTVPAQSFQASQQAQQSFSARPPIASSNSDSPAGIIWPDSKKTALATAAKIALTCTSVNAGKKISTAHIRALLDSNPSYIELCESFEGMGFVFDRGHFARSLLAAVPDVNSTVPTQSVTNAPLQNLNEANSMSRKSTGATFPASTAPGEQLIPSNAMAESNVRGPPNLTAMDGLSAIAPETPRPGPGRPSKHGSPAQPFVISPSILNRGPGRPRKDGSPAQPRKAAHLRQSYGDDADSHMPIGTLPTVGETSRAFRKDPAPSSNTANDEERLGRYGDLHRNGHGLSATRYSDDHRQSEDVGDASQIVARTEHGTPSIKEPALQNGADVGHTDRIFGSGIAGAVQRQASKKRRRFTVRWDNQRNMTKSSEVLKRQGPLLDTEVEPQNMAVDASVKRGVAPNLKGGPLRAAISSNLPPPNYGTPELSTLRVVTKEEMARKRSFDDIVDLTQDLSGEDDDLHRTSKKRHEEDAFRTSGTIQDGLSVGAFPLADPQALAVSSNPRSGVGTPITTGDISRFNYVTSGPLSQKQALYMDVIKPLNKKDALRRSEYNAKTIARDVLIATGRHPDMRPLNAHLEHLRRNFFAVAHTSDLDTFDWGLVDPDPVVNTVQGPDALMHDADDEDDGVTPAQYLTTVATPPQQARRRVMSTTNGEAEVLGNDLLVQKPGKGTLLKRRGPRRHNDPGHRARPAGIGDVGNADRNSGRVQAFTSEKKPSGQTAGADGTSDSMAHGEMRAYAAGEATSESRIPGMAQTSQLVGTDGKKPRGRPPNSARASSSTSSRGAQQLRASSSKDDTDEDMVRRRRGRPPGSKNLASPTSSGPPAGQFAVPIRPKSSANTTPARSGLRNASTPCENQPFAVVIETNSPSINSSFAPGRGAGIQRKRKSESREPIRRTRGRPSTASRAEPSYKVYDCQWQDCKAELHNLETLRKHIRKVHRAKAAFGGIPCLWADCGKVSFVQDRKTGSHTRVHHHLDFGSEALWDEHMDRKHLEAFAWGYGDGPSAGPSDGPDTDVSDYLSDRHGRRMTPQASSSGPQDALILPAKKQPLRAFNKAHGNKTELEKAQAVFRALEQRKKAIGPGIERGGCTLVTPARRAALRDNEFAVRVVDEDEDSF